MPGKEDKVDAKLAIERKVSSSSNKTERFSYKGTYVSGGIHSGMLKEG